MKNLAKFVFMIPLAVASCAWAGYVLMLQWAWFILPVFGVALTYAQAVGLTAFMSMVISRNPKEGEPENSVPFVIALAVTRPAVFLLVGYLIHIMF